jgi:hypothetical protein
MLTPDSMLWDVQLEYQADSYQSSEFPFPNKEKEEYRRRS